VWAEAMVMLRFMPGKAAVLSLRRLTPLAANAEYNHKNLIEMIYMLKTVFVNEGLL